MKEEKYGGELDYEKIVVCPYNYSTEIRQKLYKALRELNILLIAEQY